MSASVTNQAQMRAKIFSGSPKKNAAWRSFSNMNGGISPGVVITCQNKNTASSRPTCHRRSVLGVGWMYFHMVAKRWIRPPSSAAARSP